MAAPGPLSPPTWLERLFGRAVDPRNPQTYRSLALVALMAWVGLGADGLSSSCYGPEHAFLVLHEHGLPSLGVVLVLMVALTVGVISASYAQVIEQFPSGGGGYGVTTKLLGKLPGAVCGSALVVDYVLTVAISVASGVDQLFSLTPGGGHSLRVWAGLLGIAMLVLLNLEGVKESVRVLLPVFLAFVVTHVFTILYAIFSARGNLLSLPADFPSDLERGTSSLGVWGVALLLLRAYSLGGGTYTGIEAVANGAQILAHPRAKTGKRTMLYMAVSLAFTAGGLLLAFVLTRVVPDGTGSRTLNAVLLQDLYGGWPLGRTVVFIILLTEAALLFVAAQAGFVAGPRVLANMAVDRWVPHNLANLSDRLVVQNGVVFMGASAGLLLLVTRGSVGILVVMYAINVFIVFSLTQLGMCRLWLRNRGPHWRKKFAINGVGLLLTLLILVSTTVLKFAQGAWVTLAITAGVVGLCLAIHRHYLRVGKMLHRLNALVQGFELEPEAKEPGKMEPEAPTAVFFVTRYGGLGIHALLTAQRMFPGHFRNFVFVSVGVIDFDQFKGAEQVEHLLTATRGEADRYVTRMRKLGYHAEALVDVSTDPLDRIEEFSVEVSKRYPRAVFFGGNLIFAQSGFLMRILHAQSVFEIQRRLQFRGLQMMILPVRVF
ncbi:MAG: APC family permease [Planctomycetes bacterium]|nr:APC family permease [Planctomycetota bacterium]